MEPETPIRFTRRVRHNSLIKVSLKFAALRQNAIVEDIDLRTPRGIDRALFQKLMSGDWINRAKGLLITGPTGVGKSWIGCSLGHKACRDGKSVLYQRVPRLFEALALARDDGRHAQLLKTLARVQLLILDDWGLAKFTEAEQRDLLEILEDRHQRASILITSQVPVEQWHEIIGNPMLADAILDRLVHNAHRLPIKGKSMRKNAFGKHALDTPSKA
ncbi:MAG: IS21-like element helper ATPase IstB [Beijerinckiaceae bacterium]